jgi:hypothetical protein
LGNGSGKIQEDDENTGKIFYAEHDPDKFAPGFVPAPLDAFRSHSFCAGCFQRLW